MRPTRKFIRYAWGVLIYNVFVVLWGAFVRATGSGAGCGSHWPLCNGEVVPRSPRLETIIEFTHRVTSGLSIVAVVALLVWAWRLFPRGHRVRLAAGLSMALLLVEAALGAGLVLFRFVGSDASLARAGYLAAHLANTQLLLAALAATAWLAARKMSARPPAMLLAALPAALIIAMSGAVAALGDTLYPATSVAAGVRQDLSVAAGVLLRLRVLHPFLAIAGGLLIVSAAVSAIRARPSAARAAWTVAALVVAQWIAGAVNIALLAPVWMQLAHLLIANVLWIALVLTTFETARA